VHSKVVVEFARWIGAAAGLAAVVIFYQRLINANSTTVALTLLLFILFLAAKWGMRYAVITSFAAGACYNYFFLPPVGHFTISNPQNILALVVFLVTSIVASRMSNRIREESTEAHNRQAELEILYRLSRALLQTDELVELTNAIPTSVAMATGARAVLFYLLDGNRIYRSGGDWTAQLSTSELKELSHSPGIISSAGQEEAMIPLRTGVCPRGVLILRGTRLSHQSLEALGGLVSISLDRSTAIEEVTRADAAKENDRLRSLMLDSITHDLGDPLNFINTSVQTLIDEGCGTQATQELLTAVHQESNRLSLLMAQVVEMAKFDTQEVHMSFAPQRLEKIVEDAIEFNRAALDGHPVTVNFAPNLPLVEVDIGWIQKLLGNLLLNAVRYSDAGSAITIIGDTRGPFVACSVADRGAGIEPLEQAMIFDRFLRAPGKEHSSDSGVGLAICRTIVEAHGGTIGVTSQLGQGSVFTFTLRHH
jgi:two-component system sensor histidine kinase KdpD